MNAELKEIISKQQYCILEEQGYQPKAGYRISEAWTAYTAKNTSIRLK